MDNPQNVISFCTGYGGLEIGIRRAGVDVRTVCYSEIEAFCCANLAAKIEEGRMDNAPIWTDLKTFPASEFRGKVHGITGGYPCQPFSSAGKRKGEEDPRHLWPYILKHVRAIRPLWCFFENVRGHTSMGLWRVLSDLEEDGYETEWGLFSAEETGAPHQRIRCFILAKLPDTRSPYSREVQLTEGRTEEDAKEQESNCNGDQRGARQLGNPASLRPHRGSENCEGEQSEVLGERLESDAELGNTKHDGSSTTQDGRSTCKEQEEGRMQELEGGCKQSQDELANTTSRQPRQSQARNGGQDTSGGSEEELGDTTWLDGKQSNGETDQVGSACEEDRGSSDVRRTQWPARPGEEQYEWEEPRVTETQSELGRESHAGQRHDRVDAIANRVDRLRLLGNGVCPQTAELAWKTLWKELNEKR